MATMTAAQKRAQTKAQYDAFLAACPSRKLLDRISDKWVTLILAALGSEGSHQLGTDCAGEPRSMRYSELLRLLAGHYFPPRKELEGHGTPEERTLLAQQMWSAQMHRASMIKQWWRSAPKTRRRMLVEGSGCR